MDARVRPAHDEPKNQRRWCKARFPDVVPRERLWRSGASLNVPYM
jgi:hypothetical protein